VIASSSNFLYASQSYASFLADDILEGGDALPYEEGKLAVPSGPGIGVNLDRDKLERYKEAFLTAGEPPLSGSFSPVWPRL
jgi:L-alanine-DL-glutamate epimerase-like enolase superfamily enzyme